MEDEVLVCRKMSGTPFVDDHPSDIQAKSLERATNKGSLWKMKSSLVENISGTLIVDDQQGDLRLNYWTRKCSPLSQNENKKAEKST